MTSVQGSAALVAQHSIRLGVVDDHRAIAAGVPVGLETLVPLAPLRACATTVDELLATGASTDVVVLDLRLADGSDAPTNVRRLVARGCAVVILTQVREPGVIGQCLRAGASAVVGKHEEWSVLAAAVAAAARGDAFLNSDLALALESVAARTMPTLTPRETEVLSLYGAGLPMKSVAKRLGVSEETAKEYLTRVKTKYLGVGRPARTKSELYVRAVEDGHLTWPTGT